jgi:uncharacterized membrane protein SpoIIM required for sporulation
MAAAPPQSGSTPRSRDWERLKVILHRAENVGLHDLTDEELWELPSLYRRALADLSLMRRTAAAAPITSDLASLCNRAHSLVYRNVAGTQRVGPAEYILHHLPLAVRRRARYVLAAAALMLFFGVLGYVHCLVRPELAKTVLSPRLVGAFESSLRSAKDQKDLLLAAQIPVEARNEMALAITFNNINVAVRAFVFGLAGGFPTIIVLAFNGYLLGAICYLYLNTPPGFPINLPLYFFAGIAPHGAIELPAICLAAAAGMLIGLAWIFPGGRPRGEALREAARDGGRLLAASAVTLVVAGMLEVFVTPLAAPLEAMFWMKITIGALAFSGWILWLNLGGRQLERGRAHL